MARSPFRLLLNPTLYFQPTSETNHRRGHAGEFLIEFIDQRAARSPRSRSAPSTPPFSMNGLVSGRGLHACGRGDDVGDPVEPPTFLLGERRA